MTIRSLRFALPATLVALCFAAQPAAAKRLDGVFTAVKDANVVVLDYGEGSYDVRIYGIEAPAEGQPFAAEARAFVRSALLGKNGAMRFKYRNLNDEMVGRIFYRPEGEPAEHDLAIDLVSAGLAWVRPGAHYKPADKFHADELTAASLAGQAARKGIWSQPNPVAPWTFRGEPVPAEAEPTGASNGVAGVLDQNTSKKSGADNECAIAKNPVNPLQLFVLCNTSSAGLFAARSTDGGATWIYPDATDKTIADGDSGQGTSACCDPNLAWDSFGNLYLNYINSSVNAIVTILSTDGGATFSNLASFSGSVDQPSIVANDTALGVSVWIVWNASGAMVARGATATGLGAVGAFGAQQSIPSASGCSFGDVAVGPTGAVVQVCGAPTGGQGPSTLRVNTDADGTGAGGFAAVVNATTTNVGGFDFIPAQNGRSVDPEAGLAFDRNPASPHFGRLYLLYTEEAVAESNDLNIMVRHSDDIGATWSTPTQINSDATTRSQFLPKIASDPATGNVAICWHDARNSGSNTAMELFCDSFTPSGYPTTFSGNTQVSDGASTSNGSGVEFGDYSGLTLVAGVAHPVWADTSNSTGDNPNTTSNFDAYSDLYSLSLFSDGFESNNTSAWSATVQ